MTKDEVRTDLARMLRIDPAEIGDEDDLGDLGLDSLRAMSVVLAWEKEGLALDFIELSEQLTVSHWAAVAARGSKDRTGPGGTTAS